MRNARNTHPPPALLRAAGRRPLSACVTRTFMAWRRSSVLGSLCLHRRPRPARLPTRPHKPLTATRQVPDLLLHGHHNHQQHQQQQQQQQQSSHILFHPRAVRLNRLRSRRRRRPGTASTSRMTTTLRRMMGLLVTASGHRRARVPPSATRLPRTAAASSRSLWPLAPAKARAARGPTGGCIAGRCNDPDGLSELNPLPFPAGATSQGSLPRPPVSPPSPRW